MSANNNYTAVGNLGKDPEMTYTPDGKPVTKFTIAVSRYNFKTKSREAMWLNCVCFGSLAERINTYGKKGAKAAIIGELDISEYNGSDGQKRTWVSIVCTDVELISGFRTRDEFDNTPVRNGGGVTEEQRQKWTAAPGDEREF